MGEEVAEMGDWLHTEGVHKIIILRIMGEWFVAIGKKRHK